MTRRLRNSGHHAPHCRARLGLVKGLRMTFAWLRPRCARLAPLTSPPASTVLGNYVMARQIHGR
jgi:hypothetical protein